MAALARRAGLAWLALRELGPRPLGWLALYRFGLATGHYRRSTPARPLESFSAAPPRRVFPKRHPAAPLVLPPEGLLEEAAEILSGRVRLFGGEPVPLQLTPPGQPRHWTRYEGAPLPPGVEDLKFIWEPARFDWAFTLVRAAAARPSEAYAQFFWDRLAEFAAANPPNLGLNWLSAQEVALRLAALLFAGEFFTDHYPILPERQALWARCVRAHAARLRPTLPYARAQQNNHLTSEALGLFLGGLALEDAPMRDLGWRTLNQALLQQTAASGEYAQNSLNYHRVALQTALLADCAARNAGPRWVPAVRQRLAAAAGWLCAQLDPASGRAPNLGSNDGAYPFPLAPGGFADYRPTAQAACVAFEGAPGLPPGPWDEALSWLGLSAQGAPRPCASPAVHRLDAPNSWATLRAARFFSRPSHADQLHIDLWWRSSIIRINLKKQAPTNNPLFEAIAKRQTNRSVYNARTIATDTLNLIQGIAKEEGVKFYMYKNGENAFDTLTEYIRQGNEIQMKDEQFKNELLNWIRYNKHHVNQTGNGLAYATMGSPSIPKFLGKPLVKAFLKPKTQNKSDIKKVESSSHLVLFTISTNTPEEWILLGRTLERFLLETTRLRIANAYMNQPCELKELAQKIKEKLLPNDEYPMILIRLGYASPMPYSPRKSVDSVIIP